jgi:hypothetical protein
MKPTARNLIIAFGSHLGRSGISWPGSKKNPAPVNQQAIPDLGGPGYRETARNLSLAITLPRRKPVLLLHIKRIKPQICRQYPYTRKHAAIMTGCKGIFATLNFQKTPVLKGCLCQISVIDLCTCFFLLTASGFDPLSWSDPPSWSKEKKVLMTNAAGLGFITAWGVDELGLLLHHPVG